MQCSIGICSSALCLGTSWMKLLTMSCSAFSPLTVTKHEIFSFLLIANVRTVYRALPYTGCCPVSCSNTCKWQYAVADMHGERLKHSLSVQLLEGRVGHGIIHAFAAFDSLSPDSPTQMFKINLETLISRIGLLAFLSFCSILTSFDNLRSRKQANKIARH